jgi:CzcA family heavy metal efflux pump
MFRWIVGSSLQFRFIVWGLAAALVAFGVHRVRSVPVDVFPEFAAPVVEVQTEALGLSANEVESLITLNLEELLSGVPWLKSIRSKSVTGLSSIVLTFEPGTDVLRARQMMQERLTLAYTLPNVASPPVILQPLSATSRFMMIGLASKEVEPTELSLVARWTIKPKLTGVPGVANVSIWGQRLRQMHVQIDPERLRSARVVQDDIIATAGDALWVSPLTFLRGSAPGTGGWIDNRNQRLGVHHDMPIKSPEDMAKIAIGAQHLVMTGRSMALGEVAEVTYAHAPLIGDAIVEGRNGLMLVVEKFPAANTLEVTRGVEQALAELKRGLPGVAIEANVFRLASYIEDSIANLTRAIAIGALLVLVVIGAFLTTWRSALVCVASIVAALVAALVVLAYMGATINTMVLAGLVLALGVVIDDAIVDAERLIHRLAERAEGETVAAIVLASTLETRRALLYATLIIVLAVAPIVLMGGVAGAFFAPLALAYALAVVASMIVALTLTPALSVALLGPTAGRAREPKAAAWLHARYAPLVARVLAAPRRAFVAAGALVLVAAAVWPLLGQSLLPELAERELIVNLATAPGTSHTETYRITARMSEELRGLPGVRSVGAHVGRAVTGDQVVGVNSSQIWVGVDPAGDRRATVAAVRATVDGYPGLERNVQSYLRDRINEVLSGAIAPLVVRLYGPRADLLRAKADEVRAALADVPGVVDLRSEGRVEEPQVQVKVNLDAAGRANVKPGDVRRNSATVFSGLTVGYLFEDQKINDVVVWGAPETRASLTNLKELSVARADRQHVRLSDVADVRIVPTPTVIRHEGIAPYVDVVANVASRDLGAVVDEVEDRLDKIDFPLEHNPRILGEYAERKAAEQRIVGIAIAAVIGIFFLLQALFRSWGLALVAFVALPASIAGGVLAAAITGGVISLGSIVGLLAVVGIAARSTLMLVDHYRQLEQTHGAPLDAALVARGANDRLVPIVVSALAVVAALVPLAVAGRLPGLEIIQPIAIAIIGGVIASTCVTLFVIPALYLAYGRRARREPDLALERG